MKAAAEPLLAGEYPSAVTLQPTAGKFLNGAFFAEKLRGFRKYDPSIWRDTLQLHISGFMLVPFWGLVLWTLALFLAGKVFPFLMPLLSVGPQVHTVLGAALSFIMVFRTNTAYSRWWEARLQWGVVNNTTRSLVTRAPTMLKNEASYTDLVTQLMAFAVALKNHLRGCKTSPSELGALLPYALMVELGESANPPLAAIQALAVTVRHGIKTATPDDACVANAAFLQLSNALDALANCVGACERIRNTPTPFGYVAALRGFMLLWLFTMPLTLIGTYGIVAVPAMALVGFLFINLEMMAMEIEQPFGDDADDLPLEQYCLGIETVCLDFLKRSPYK